LVINELRLKNDLNILLYHAKMARSSFYFHIKQSTKIDKAEDAIYKTIHSIQENQSYLHIFIASTMLDKNIDVLKYSIIKLYLLVIVLKTEIEISEVNFKVLIEHNKRYYQEDAPSIDDGHYDLLKTEYFVDMQDIEKWYKEIIKVYVGLLINIDYDDLSDTNVEPKIRNIITIEEEIKELMHQKTYLFIKIDGVNEDIMALINNFAMNETQNTDIKEIMLLLKKGSVY
jgi:hypothetical protein